MNGPKPGPRPAGVPGRHASATEQRPTSGSFAGLCRVRTYRRTAMAVGALFAGCVPDACGSGISAVGTGTAPVGALPPQDASV